MEELANQIIETNFEELDDYKGKLPLMKDSD